HYDDFGSSSPHPLRSRPFRKRVTVKFLFRYTTSSTDFLTLSLHDALPIYSVINIKLGEHIVALCSPNLILITLYSFLLNRSSDQIGRAVQQECRDRSRMLSSA